MEEQTPETWLWNAIKARCGEEAYQELRTEYIQRNRVYNRKFARQKDKYRLEQIETQIVISSGSRKAYLEKEAEKIRKRLEQ